MNPNYSIHFFATRGDLEPGFRVLDKKQSFRLVCVDDYFQAKTFPVIELNEKALLAGKIETMHENRVSKELFNLLRNELLRGFTSAGSFEVGAEALALLKSGGRLTVDAQAAPMLDLTLS